MTTTEVATLQQRLNEQGHGPLFIDGRYGPKTEAAYREYLDKTDPETPTIIPPPVRPWYLQPAVLAGLAALAVSAFGLDRYGITSDTITQSLDLVITAIVGLVALWSGIKGSPPVDKGAVLPGIVRPVANELRDQSLPPGRQSGSLDNHSL